MRFTKRAHTADTAFIQQPRERMHHRCFKRLGSRKRRQDAGQAGGQHGFARTRTAHHQHMVAAGSGNFQGAFGALLPFDITQIARGGIMHHFARFRRAYRAAPGIVADHLIQ